MAPKKARRHPWRENLETLTGAIVLALIFKAFLVEISRIPSPSMQPTLMGDPHNGLSDRVLVDKLSFRYRDPERWEIVVFKHPLQRSRNMVKRVVGMPGEDLKIENGDVWVRRNESSAWELARRPRSVQGEMWRNVDFEEPRVSNWRGRDGGADWNLVSRDIAARGSGRARFRPDWTAINDRCEDGHPDAFRTVPPRCPGSPPELPNHGVNPVGDLRVEGEVEMLAGCELVAAHIAEGSRLYRFLIPGPAAQPDAAPEIQVWNEATFLAGGGEPIASSRGAGSRLRAGDRVSIAAQNLDDRLILDIDGEQIAELDVDPVEVLRSYVEVAQVGAGADFTDLRVLRDIYYVPGPTLGKPTTIPAGHFYMLGDNTWHSADSREWVFREYSLPNHGGSPFVVRGNFRQGGENPSPLDRSGSGVVFFRDEWGERHSFAADLEPDREGRSGVVQRDLIRGRALAVFWPISLRFGIWRLSWLH